MSYPGRHNRRILRRAKSLQMAEKAATNQRYRCCRRPHPVEVSDAAVFTTSCKNCGATI